MENQHRYTLIVSAVVLIVIVIQMALSGSWRPAVPVYLLGSVLVLYSIWNLIDPSDK